MLNKYILKRVVFYLLILCIIPLCMGCEKDNHNTNKTTTKTTIKDVTKKDTNKLVYEGVDITPGKTFDYTRINKEPKISTIPSCAFDGNDHVYTYDDIEITANIIASNDTEQVYSVYFIKDTYSASNGLKIGNTVEEMKNILGNEDDEFNGVYTYNKDNITIKIQTKDNNIISIEYVLK